MAIVLRMNEKTFNLKGESRLMTAAVSSGGFNPPSDSHQDKVIFHKSSLSKLIETR